MLLKYVWLWLFGMLCFMLYSRMLLVVLMFIFLVCVFVVLGIFVG